VLRALRSLCCPKVAALCRASAVSARNKELNPVNIQTANRGRDTEIYLTRSSLRLSARSKLQVRRPRCRLMQFDDGGCVTFPRASRAIPASRMVGQSRCGGKRRLLLPAILNAQLPPSRKSPAARDRASRLESPISLAWQRDCITLWHHSD
jgi:hypothetical protein